MFQAFHLKWLVTVWGQENMPSSRPRCPRQSFPITVKIGSASVVIYRTPTTVDGKKYVQYTLSYYLSGQRIRRKFADLNEARREAELAAKLIASGESAVLTLTSEDRASYVRALELIQEAKKPLVSVAHEYMEALRILPENTTLIEACRDYSRRNSQVTCNQTLAELAETYLASLKKNNRSIRHIQTQKSRISRFVAAFNCKPNYIRRPAIEAYLDGLGVAARTRKNEISAITAFVNWMVRLKYASSDLTEEIQAIQKPKVQHPDVIIWTVGEMRELLTFTPKELLPFVVLGGFCGIRTAELLRLNWEDLTPCGDYIAVKARKGTAARRTVPISRAAKQWLASSKNRSGPIVPFKRSENIIRAITESINNARQTAKQNKFSWKPNALRHSYGSYRVATTQNIYQTALEMGNSVRMIQQHYLHLVTPKDGKLFFSISPNKTT